MIPIFKSSEPDIFNRGSFQKRIDAFNKEVEDIQYWRQKIVRFRVAESDLAALKIALLNESHGKCVYCEQLLFDPRFMEIDHFRPISGALDREGKRSDRHYYWLAYEWSNLFASCAECNRAKGPKFPVASHRLPERINSPDLDSYEHPMLLNPSRFIPGKHLAFKSDGMVEELSLEGGYTISICKLNRQNLVARRVAHLEDLKTAIQHGNGISFLNDNAEFAGMCRNLYVSLGGTLPTVPKSPTEFVEENSAADEIGEAQDEFYSTFPLIRKIEIKGIFGITSLALNIPENKDGLPGWLAILGENGVGKSSVLRAVALALYDGNAAMDLGLQLNDLLSQGTEKASVAVYFDTGQSRALEINAAGLIRSTTETVSVLVLGYGATRLSANNSHRFEPSSDMARIANLFDPYTPLRDPSEWLASLEEKEFDYAALAIKRLLNLPDDCYLSRPKDSPELISLNSFGIAHKLGWLSQGYQTVLTVACDIMAMVFGKWASMDDAQGIVLLDELENHLHPTWKMRIVSNLRAAFPRMQFIVTTHDPLCLRGLMDGEVALMRRSSTFPYLVETVQGLPSTADMRIDQILTSSYFGLRTTVDPDIEEFFEEYYDLLDREYTLEPNESLRLDALKIEVKKYDLPALLDRDRLMYKAIDHYLAKRKNPLPTTDNDFDVDILQEIDKITEALALDIQPKP